MGGALVATNVVTGTSSAFVSVPAGSQAVKVTATTTTTPGIPDLGSQTLTAGKNVTLVVAPPAGGVARAFLVPSC